MVKSNQLTREIVVKKNGDRKILKFKSLVCSQFTNQLNKTVAMLSYYIVFLGVPEATTSLNDLLFDLKHSTVVLYYDNWKLPGEIDTVKIILCKEIMDPVDSHGT